MTETDFRSSPAHRVELRAALETPSFQAAKRILLDAFMGTDAGGDGINSVRILSCRGGFERAFQRLEELTLLPPEPQLDPEMDYGQPEAASKLREVGELPEPFQPR